jgi:hypothetical protein
MVQNCVAHMFKQKLLHFSENSHVGDIQNSDMLQVSDQHFCKLLNSALQWHRDGIRLLILVRLLLYSLLNSVAIIKYLAE